ncbi:MAG: Asp23/Gls24 family envelope stress response protein [Ruminiclostridium sp.]|nr:Asp23/Gls24 family envelope stress response protein [Ruminiclostridium sp.]
MVLIRDHLGEINISKQFFSQLIGGTLTDCFGVADTNACSPKQTFFDTISILRKKKMVDKGVSVRSVRGKLRVDLHITVMYGLNISSIVKSIQHKIAYVIEEETDISVESVNVYVDGIKSITV